MRMPPILLSRIDDQEMQPSLGCNVCPKLMTQNAAILSLSEVFLPKAHGQNRRHLVSPGAHFLRPKLITPNATILSWNVAFSTKADDHHLGQECKVSSGGGIPFSFPPIPQPFPQSAFSLPKTDDHKCQHLVLECSLFGQG